MGNFVLLSRLFNDGLFNNISVQKVTFTFIEKALILPEGTKNVGFWKYSELNYSVAY
jgi:hypothetical protein